MRDRTDEDYARFEEGLVKLYSEIFGETLTQWVLPVLVLDEEMRVKEDVLVPDAQLVQNTMGMLVWANTKLQGYILNSDEDEDE